MDRLTQTMPFKPISDEICSACGEPIDVQPGETFTASTDGKVWHYGCSPSRTRRSQLADKLERFIAMPEWPRFYMDKEQAELCVAALRSQRTPDILRSEK